ncbi:hypothetical protein BO94DRAFT_64061 [Aspergillus sclerotioniger CBS 115572]|uniref:Uncharacterized protein n=1 Tax=Aspergillus sclerotioniger CBS 115572 TaxID=1450535 RepID=A0A317WNN2_9EURO|nr:hypothetical protein BO94DRAFT_64061 [Aspergillus sclerotioniger CBS 115572]PWY88079.1 hypothetical protein BO94DRAFT_64061 [Aspergillus sclerotioniger CBS 115572]
MICHRLIALVFETFAPPRIHACWSRVSGSPRGFFSHSVQILSWTFCVLIGTTHPVCPRLDFSRSPPTVGSSVSATPGPAHVEEALTADRKSLGIESTHV